MICKHCRRKINASLLEWYHWVNGDAKCMTNYTASYSYTVRSGDRATPIVDEGALYVDSMDEL